MRATEQVTSSSMLVVIVAAPPTLGDAAPLSASIWSYSPSVVFRPTTRLAADMHSVGTSLLAVKKDHARHDADDKKDLKDRRREHPPPRVGKEAQHFQNGENQGK